MEPPILRVVRAPADAQSPSVSAPVEPEPPNRPLRWTVPLSSAREGVGRAGRAS